MNESNKVKLISKNLPKHFNLRPSIRTCIFSILFLSTIASHITMSLFRASSQVIKKELKLTDSQYGFFGSLYHLGKFIGTVLLIFVINRQNRKRMIINDLFFLSILLSFFKFTKNKFILMPSFFLIGIFVMAINIFVPIWIDQFCTIKLKTIFLTMIQFAKAFGLVLGFILNYFMKSENYQNQFLLNSISILIFAILLSFFPILYFSSRVSILHEVKGNEEFNFILNKKPTSIKSEEIEIDRDSNIITMFGIRTSNESTAEINFGRKLCKILFNKFFFSSVFSAMILLTSVTSFNFWIIEYIPLVLKISDEKYKLYTYLIITISGPLGGLITNIFLSLILGQKGNIYSPFFMFLIYVITVIAGNSITYIENNYILFLVSCIIYSMGASSVNPMIQSICLSSVSTSLKGISFTLFNLMIHLFGEVPSSYIYGYLQEKFIEENKKNNVNKEQNIEKKAMSLMMMYSLFGIFFAFLSFCFNCCKFDHKKQEKEIFNDDDEVELQNQENESTGNSKSKVHRKLKSFESDKLDIVSENAENIDSEIDN
jgi:predicted MFS family arabinose efflux permease